MKCKNDTGICAPLWSQKIIVLCGQEKLNVQFYAFEYFVELLSWSKSLIFY